MSHLVRTAGCAGLLLLYLFLNRKYFGKVWRQYRSFSLKRFLGFVTYVYQPVAHHWFYKVAQDNGRVNWVPFSLKDSGALEEGLGHSDVVPTNGGRYDVHVASRLRIPVYWKEQPNEARRCSWFCRFTSGKLVPYEEDVAQLLEEEFKRCFEEKRWNRKTELPNGDVIHFQRPDSIHVHSMVDDRWQGAPQTHPIYPAIKRGFVDFDIAEGEAGTSDHLLFVVHGIGSVCDLKFRTVEEVADNFRNLASHMIRTHYGSAFEKRLVTRLEVLPINWHAKLHSEDTGIDTKLKNITLPSVPLIRDFINDTLSDILLYKSPKFGQIILNTVGAELNRIYEIFRQRNPGFQGGVFLAGHSLGSLILFDLLGNQKPDLNDDGFSNQESVTTTLSSKLSGYGLYEPPLQYPHLHFHPLALFTMGSPIGLFITTTGLEQLGEDFALPTCPGFFNVFHPYDLIANRIETLVNPLLVAVQPEVIPHHKGGKRIHLQLKETMLKVRSGLKTKLKRYIRKIFRWHRFRPVSGQVPEADSMPHTLASVTPNPEDIGLGILNGGRRIDYVLQEAPIESVNEYIVAATMSSHLVYWESKDTVLMILKEIYATDGVEPDATQSSSISNAVAEESSTSFNVETLYLRSATLNV